MRQALILKTLRGCCSVTRSDFCFERALHLIQPKKNSAAPLISTLLLFSLLRLTGLAVGMPKPFCPDSPAAHSNPALVSVGWRRQVA